MSKKALITGITGQDGSYLAELLLEKGYEVHGIIRRASSINTWRIDAIVNDIHLHFGELTDACSIMDIVKKVQPDEVYNLASMSHVRVSFDIPFYTGMVTGLGVCVLLECLKILKPDAKFYQASSSEMFGISSPPQNENTPFQPQSPYGCAKLYGYWLVKSYRTGYKMFASNGILFNHESERRGETFVTKKIIRKAVEIKQKKEKKIVLGNIDSKRDWGYAKDYMEAVHKILQHKEPDDFVIATEEYYSIREFAEKVFKKLGLNFYDYLEFNEKYIRPNEVPELKGDATKAKKILGWKPKTNIDQLIDIMLNAQLKTSS